MKKEELKKIVKEAIGEAGLSTFNKRADKERMQNNPKYARTIEWGREFGGGSTLASALKDALNSSGKQLGSRGLMGSLGSALRKALKEGVGKRGAREFLPANAVPYLTGFEFSHQALFYNIFPLSVSLEASADRKELTLTVPAFNPYNSLDHPPGASHFRLLVHGAFLTAYSWNTKANLYVSNQPDEDRKHAKTFSDYLPLDQNISAPLEVKATFDAGQVLSAETAVVGCVGIEFYQEVNGEMYALSTDSCLRVEKMFV